MPHEAVAATAPMPLVSVIIPVWNCAGYLARALDSVRNQRYPHDRIEIVLVDDGSTDSTPAIAADYAARDRRITVLQQTNAGPAAARNRAIRASKGSLIAFLDADDTWASDKLHEQATLCMADPQVGLVHCGVRFVDPQGDPIRNWMRQTRIARGDILLEFVLDFFLITSAVMVPRRCLDAVGLFDESLRVGEDNDLFLRLLSRYRVACVDSALLNRTVRADSLSREDFDLDARNDLLILDRFLAAHPDFARRHRQQINQRYAAYLYEYGYRLLETGQVQRARTVLLGSLRRHATLGAAKALVRSALPPAATRMLRT